MPIITNQLNRFIANNKLSEVLYISYFSFFLCFDISEDVYVKLYNNPNHIRQLSFFLSIVTPNASTAGFIP